MFSSTMVANKIGGFLGKILVEKNAPGKWEVVVTEVSFIVAGWYYLRITEV